MAVEPSVAPYPNPLFKGFVPQTFPYVVLPYINPPQLTPVQTISVGTALGVKWWINYLPSTTFEIPGAQFCPMIFDQPNYLSPTNLALCAQRKIILGFNEPDQPAPQANMTPSAALALWHQFEVARASVPGCRLGAPVVSGQASVNGTGHPWPGAGSSWLWDFMKGPVPETGLPPVVDFIPLHFYTTTYNNPAAAAAGLLNYCAGTFLLYRLPLWITELGAINFAGSGPTTWIYPADFSQASTTLDGLIRSGALPLFYVERCAWYPNVWNSNIPNPAGGGDPHSVELCDLTGALSALGSFYAARYNFG